MKQSEEKFNTLVRQIDESLRKMYEAVYEIHENVNQKYDSNYPYSFHLNMVKNVVIANMRNMLLTGKVKNYIINGNVDNLKVNREIFILLLAAVEHDLIEDTRTTYHDLLKINKNFVTTYFDDSEWVPGSFNKGELNQIALDITEIVYALTDEKGRNRDERHNEKYWKCLSNNDYACFIKLCDRYANMLYSEYISSDKSMYKKYLAEVKDFDKILVDSKKLTTNLFKDIINRFLYI